MSGKLRADDATDIKRSITSMLATSATRTSFDTRKTVVASDHGAGSRSRRPQETEVTYWRWIAQQLAGSAKKSSGSNYSTGAVTR
jgi:hypothetical protein